MEKFSTLISKIVCFDADDIDTDQVIPARFLKRTEKTGFGDALFHDLRYCADGSLRDSFPLNLARGDEQVLVAGKNFGCGSSREHAAWALRDFGFRAILAPSFADIFRINALNNGLLPVILPAEFIREIMTLSAREQVTVLVDLEKEEVAVSGTSLRSSFPVDAYRKRCLLNGYDDTGLMLTMTEEILRFEMSRPYQKII
ncbi:MAG: 3-isopropylmalate dehydratase small subunit [Bacteroidetes bacterium]|nr:MAG: 3-isopropylmalate dehydratase small subunit [Bacteroidota bacterium]